MPNLKNVELLSSLKQKIQKSKSIIFVDYKGLKANDSVQLRKKLGESEAEVEISKNTLLKIALNESGSPVADETILKNSTMTIFSYGDPVAPIKKLFEFIKNSPALKVKLGFLEGKLYTAGEIEVLSNLPSKEVLIAKVLSGFNSPISGFVNVLSGTKRNFVYALNEVSKKKGQTA